MTDIAKTNPFRQSRIYAEGWNAARKAPQDIADNSQAMADLNPYRAEPERTRWNEGFRAAFA